MKTCTIYLNEDKTRFRVIKPSEQFKGDWKGLVQTITNGLFHSYTIN